MKNLRRTHKTPDTIFDDIPDIEYFICGLVDAKKSIPYTVFVTNDLHTKWHHSMNETPLYIADRDWAYKIKLQKFH